MEPCFYVLLHLTGTGIIDTFNKNGEKRLQTWIMVYIFCLNMGKKYFYFNKFTYFVISFMKTTGAKMIGILTMIVNKKQIGNTFLSKGTTLVSSHHFVSQEYKNDKHAKSLCQPPAWEKPNCQFRRQMVIGHQVIGTKSI